MTTELAKRAVACKHWRWMPGMLIKADEEVDRICIAWEDGMLECRDIEIIGDQIADVLPDLDDPATLGCLLALVREAYGLPIWVRNRFVVMGGHDICWCDGPHSTAILINNADSEAEALVAALEAAP
jgi:hypothetical protein